MHNQCAMGCAVGSVSSAPPGRGPYPRAAFSVAELREAATVLGDAVRMHHTFLVPFLVAIRSRHPHRVRATTQSAAREVYRELGADQQRDFRDMVRFFAHGGFPLACRPW